MKPDRDLRDLLMRIDGRGYPAYREIRGVHAFPGFDLLIDHVQGDPFAAPSRLRVRVPMEVAGFPESSRTTRIRSVALRDFLARGFAAACLAVRERSGSGKSGLVAMDAPGQEILERSSIQVTADFVEARFVAGLPAQGRRVLGREAVSLLCERVPLLVEQTLCYQRLDRAALDGHLDAAEDADHLRGLLPGCGLVAFVADGSCLARRTGVDDRPLSGEEVRLFRSPASLRREFQLPHAGRVAGMGVGVGVTLIVGGGYHGKSTLLSAIERGVYNHVPGDGRELVVTDPTAVKVRAEDGRRVEGVDLRPFINHLPGKGDPACFRTENASGSTSQAANIMEALEAGAAALLLDEDTCATNLMIRDARMQELVEASGEPITPLVDWIRQLAESGVSSVLVLGGSGDYFEAADRVIRMDAFVARDVTAEAKRIAAGRPTGRRVEAGSAWPGRTGGRALVAASFDPARGRREVHIKGRALRAVSFGEEEVDLSLVSQLVDEGQVCAIGRAMDLVRRRLLAGGGREMGAVITGVMGVLAEEGLDGLDGRYSGEYVEFRGQELAAALNRLRSLRVEAMKPVTGKGSGGVFGV